MSLSTELSLRNNKKEKKETQKYTFKYALNRFINEYRDIITPLSQEQINTANHIFEQVETYLTKKYPISLLSIKYLIKLYRKSKTVFGLI